MTQGVQREVSDSIFEEYLNIELTLQSEGKKEVIHSGHIDRIDLDLAPYGFIGKVHFSGFNNDALDAMVVSDKIIELELQISLAAPRKGMPDPLITLKALVTDKAYVKSDQVWSGEVRRSYVASFMDNARVIWGHHYPVEIHVDKSMKEVISAQAGPKIPLEYAWDALEKKHPILAYSLRHHAHDSSDKGVCFYSFLQWYLYKEGGLLSYDYEANTYTLRGEKHDAHPTPKKIYEWWVEPPVCHFPDPSRFKQKQIDHTSDKLEAKLQALFDAYETTRRDLFDDESYRTFPQLGPRESKTVLTQQKVSIETSIRMFDLDFSLCHLIPGTLVQFEGNPKRPKTWSSDTEFKGKVFRTQRLSLVAEKCMVSDGVKKVTQPFALALQVSFEDKDEKASLRPAFKAPNYPFHIQGRIHSKVGDNAQTTYQVDEEVPKGQYLVDVPLVEGEGKVVVPFAPTMLSGQYYFPLCKKESVLLAMNFQTAQIERILDWQPLTQLPKGDQGNQIVFASNGHHYYTWMRHEFHNGDHSVFTIEQASSSTQKRLFELKDKQMIRSVLNSERMMVNEVFDEEKGVTLVIKDHQTGVTNKLTIDGEAMVLTSEDKAGKSIITQKPDSISVNCKRFTVDADDIVLKANQTITEKATSKVDIEAPVANVICPDINLGK